MHWRHLMWILWPSFLAAGVGCAILFALVDPLDVAFFGHLHLSRETVYAGGFFLLWFVATCSSAISLYMAPPPRSGEDLID